MKSELLHEKRTFNDVRELLEWAAEAYAERNAYSFKRTPGSERECVSFTKFRDDVRAVASALIEMGADGKHCVLVGKMSYEWAVIYYSVLISGGVLVPLDKDWQAEELARTAERADAALAFADAELAAKAEAIEARCALIRKPMLIGTDGEGSFDSLLRRGRELFEKDSTAYFEKKIDAHRLSLLVFTSGTTGEGKGVMLTQNAVLSDICDIVPYIDFSDKTVGVLPPHHTYGSSVTLIGHIMIGCEVYISGGLRYIQKELKDEAPGHLILVPLYLETFYRKIHATVKEQGKEKLLYRMIGISNFLRKLGIDLRNKLFASVRAAFGGRVKMIISGGAPINQQIIDFFEAIGISTLNGYGITECAPIIAVNRSRRSVKGSVGPVLNINEVVIADTNDAGEGEIIVRGPNVMLGYYKNEEATREAFTDDGYFKTGDYGRLDGDVLTITGRKKNLIILSNGKNVYPEEIERDLIAIPGILEVVVYEGVSRRGTEHNAIVAEIFPDAEYCRKNGITDIKTYLNGHVNEYNKNAVPYKKIAEIKVRDTEFPKNTLRKIMRFKLDTSID